MLNYRAPFLIVLSFFMLVVMPQFFTAFTIKTIEESAFKYTLFFSIVNCSMDALIYIWLTPRIRKGVIALFSYCFCCRKQRIIEIRSERRPANTFSTVQEYLLDNSVYGNYLYKRAFHLVVVVVVVHHHPKIEFANLMNI